MAKKGYFEMLEYQSNRMQSARLKLKFYIMLKTGFEITSNKVVFILH